MSEVFISYARSTEAAARLVEVQLRALGYEVWRDDELPAHRAFTKVIDEKLKAAKAVVVVWSAEAVESEWVQSEADRARQDRKLVQLTIDGAALPMPFDRIQCADLTGWAGERESPGWRKVVGSVAELVGRAPRRLRHMPSGQSDPPEPAAVGGRPPSGLWRSRRVLGLAAAVAAAGGLAAGVWFWRSGLPTPSAGSGELKVAVLPFETLSAGQDVRFFADSLPDEIAGALSSNQIEPVSRDASAALRGPGAGQAAARLGVRLVVDGAARSEDGVMHVQVRLDDPRAQVTLWSRELEAPAQEVSALPARVAHRLVDVLGCSSDALQSNGGLSDLGLVNRYLHACDVFGDPDVHLGYDLQGAAEWVDSLTKVTAKAPGFIPAQAALAMTLAVASKGAPADQAAGLRQQAQVHLRTIGADTSAAYAVRSALAPNAEWGERERLLRQAVAGPAGTGDPVSNMWLGTLLVETGRVQEGLTYTRRATAGALVFDWGIFNAILSCGSDPSGQALKDIEGSRRILPQSGVVQDDQVLCLEYAGRFSDARTLLASLGGQTPYRNATTRAFLNGMVTGSDADRDRARRVVLAAADQSPTGLANAIWQLSSLGFLDDAFALAQRYDPNAAQSGPNPNFFMFTPLTSNMRRDPRFMRLAARIGLVDYWRSSGHWPDFCAEPGLPYDCKAEAARLAAKPPS
jgi:TolB-like protein